MTTRREVITLLGGAAAWSFAAGAQQQGERVRRIGVLLPAAADDAEFQTRIGENRLNRSKMPSRPGEFHPEPLTDPDLTLSRHPARATARRLPPSVENWSSSCCQLARSQRR